MKTINIIGIIVLAVILIWGIPIGINEAYKCSKYSYVTYWSAADVLSFYGSLLGGVVTLLAIYLTIRDGDKKREQDKVYSEEQREKDRKYNDEQRERDRKEERNMDRYRFVSGLLLNSLHNLDGSYLLLFKEHTDELLGLKSKLLDLAENAGSTKIARIEFTFDEKEILFNVLNELQEYAERYRDYLYQMYVAASILEYDENHRDKPNGRYKGLSDEARMTAFNTFARFHELVVKMYDEKYKDVLTVSIHKGLEKLEQYFFDSDKIDKSV